MSKTRNIVVVGASIAGLSAAHYIAKHLLRLKNSNEPSTKLHLYVISPSSDFYFRIAAPRVATSTSRMAAENIFSPLAEAFKDYKQDDFTWIQASATGLDPGSRAISYKKKDGSEGKLEYHALIVATGSSTYHPAFSMSNDKEATMNAIKKMNVQVEAAKSIVIVGGGPTAVETAGELGEHLNGKPGWFSTPPPKVDITLVTSADRLMPTLRPSISKDAEIQLKNLGVNVRYNARVANAQENEDSTTTVTLANDEKLSADLYIPAYGVQPNSSWLPPHLLNDHGYLQTNTQTLRVDGAGPRVYAIGDISSASRNSSFDIMMMSPVLFTNLKRDLLSFHPQHPNRPAPGKDRNFVLETRAVMIAPVGSGGGVGEVFGWRVPRLIARLIKGRDYLVGMSVGPIVTGSRVVGKEIKWTKEEMVQG